MEFDFVAADFVDEQKHLKQLLDPFRLGAAANPQEEGVTAPPQLFPPHTKVVNSIFNIQQQQPPNTTTSSSSSSVKVKWYL